MKWVERTRKNDLIALIAIILVINAVLCIWICSVIGAISSEVLLTSKEVVIEDLLSYEGTLALWNNASIVVILAATGLVMASLAAPLLIPQPHRLKKSK